MSGFKPDLPKPPDVDRADPVGSLERLTRWAVDLHEKVTLILADVVSDADKAARPVRLPKTTVARLAALEFRAGEDARLVYVTDEAGGAVPAFSDGSDWRRLTDRTVVS